MFCFDYFFNNLVFIDSMDSLEKRVKLLFAECRRSPNELPAHAEAEFQSIRKDYYRTLEDADEKVHLASQMYELVDRYLRRLDTELHKFKCELEADNKGITEVLEKRSLELDTPSASTPQVVSSSQKENRLVNIFLPETAFYDFLLIGIVREVKNVEIVTLRRILRKKNVKRYYLRQVLSNRDTLQRKRYQRHLQQLVII